MSTVMMAPKHASGIYRFGMLNMTQKPAAAMAAEGLRDVEAFRGDADAGEVRDACHDGDGGEAECHGGHDKDGLRKSCHA